MCAQSQLDGLYPSAEADRKRQALVSLLLLAAMAGLPPVSGAGDLIFSDGFETGDTSRWSSVVGELTCIPSGTDEDIQSALTESSSVAELCPGAVFTLHDTVTFTAPDQEIRTQGLPTDRSRALLRVAGPEVTTAVAGTDRSGVVLRHVIIDGGRPELGIGFGGLIEFGGAASDQVVEWVKAYEPRGWSVLVVNEGAGLACTGATVRNNHLGPAGRAEYIFADGISLACRSSIVTDNTIVDATDGGIVIFQAPGSLVARNQIRAESRIMFYGISMVDEGPFDNDFTGTQVSENVIDASGALIRHGIDMGPWVGCIPPEAATTRNRGARVQGNVLSGEHMGYGFVVAGVEDWTVTGNVDESTHVPPRWQHDCFGQDVDPPAGFQIDLDLSSGTFQPEFQDAVLGFGLNLWPLQPIVSEACVADLIGASLLEQIKDGLLGPIWPAIEAADGGDLIDPCITEYAPPPVPPGAEAVIVAIDSCDPYCVSVTLHNAGEETASLENAVFLLQDFVTSCVGMPASIPPDEQVTCVLDDFVADGFQVLSWYGFSPGPDNSIVFEYPFEP